MRRRRTGICALAVGHPLVEIKCDLRTRVLRSHLHAFVAASPEREIVVATGSGHQVMRDRPEMLVAEIARMVRIVRAR